MCPRLPGPLDFYFKSKAIEFGPDFEGFYRVLVDDGAVPDKHHLLQSRANNLTVLV